MSSRDTMAWRRIRPMPTAFHIDASRSGDAAVLSLHGELDVATTAQLEEALAVAAGEHPRRLIVDLSGLEFMDSTGLRAVLAANENAREGEHEFVLVQGPHQVQRLLELTRAVDHLQIAADLEELLGEDGPAPPRP
jgi:anti-sigma B factor antagonist